MKIEIEDLQLIDAIVEKVVERLGPLLNGNTTEEDIIFTVETRDRKINEKRSIQKVYNSK
jgi:hypothetical protein